MEVASLEQNPSSIAWCPIGELAAAVDHGSVKCSPQYLLASAHQKWDNSFNSTSQIDLLNTSPSAIHDRHNRSKAIPSLGSIVLRAPLTAMDWGLAVCPLSNDIK